jgi:hypothetical protein
MVHVPWTTGHTLDQWGPSSGERVRLILLIMPTRSGRSYSMSSRASSYRRSAPRRPNPLNLPLAALGALQAMTAPAVMRSVRNAFTPRVQQGAKPKRTRVKHDLKSGKRKLVFTSVLPYRTKGYGPRKFKRGKKIGTDPFKKRGSEIVLEYGGVDTDAEVAAVGHYSMPILKVWESVWRAIYRSLMARCGFTFMNWDDVYLVTIVNRTTRFTIAYRQSEDAALSYVTLDGSTHPTAQKSHKTFAQELATNMFNAIYNIEKCILVSITLDEIDTTIGTMRLGTLQLADAHIVLQCSSVMTMQNRTLGQSATETSVDDVTNNPITGRSWDVTGNSAISRSGTASGANGTAAGDSGVIVGFVGTTGDAKVNAANTYSYSKRSGRVSLQPGAIKKSVLKSSYDLKLNSYVSKIFAWLQSSNTTASTGFERVAMGESRLFSFEKLCDTRAGDQNLSVGFEINLRIASYMYNKSPMTNRLCELIN